MYKNIIPECYIDTCLADTFMGVKKTEKGTNHTKGVPEVFRKLENKFKDNYAICIIDKDKKPVKAQSNFNIINSSISDYALLYKHAERHHYIIQLCPESETWICKTTKALNIDLVKDFKLPDNPVELSNKTKRLVNIDNNFKLLFDRIISEAIAQNFEPVNKMKTWIRYIHKEGFNSDIKVLSQ